MALDGDVFIIDLDANVEQALAMIEKILQPRRRRDSDGNFGQQRRGAC